MIQWRYLTTIRGMVAETAALYGGDLYVAGRWGPDDTYGDRDEWASLVRIDPHGEVGLCYEWPEPGFGQAFANSANGIIDAPFAIGTWGERLWLSGDRSATPNGATPNARLASFDGSEWATHAEFAYRDLVGSDMGLVCGHIGGLSVFDGLAFEQILYPLGYSAGRSIQVTPDGAIMCICDPRPLVDTSGLYTVTLDRSGGAWRAMLAPFLGNDTTVRFWNGKL